MWAKDPDVPVEVDDDTLPCLRMELWVVSRVIGNQLPEDTTAVRLVVVRAQLSKQLTNTYSHLHKTIALIEVEQPEPISES